MAHVAPFHGFSSALLQTEIVRVIGTFLTDSCETRNLSPFPRQLNPECFNDDVKVTKGFP